MLAKEQAVAAASWQRRCPNLTSRPRLCFALLQLRSRCHGSTVRYGGTPAFKCLCSLWTFQNMQVQTGSAKAGFSGLFGAKKIYERTPITSTSSLAKLGWCRSRHLCGPSHRGLLRWSEPHGQAARRIVVFTWPAACDSEKRAKRESRLLSCQQGPHC